MNKKKQMRFDIVKMTPRLAAEMLAKPWVRQRSLSQRTVDKYARAMTEGRWEEPSLDPIAFTTEDELGNGQHRLSAVIKAGWVGDMLIAYDVPAENFLVHDTGRHRIASQFVRTPNAKIVASIARLVLWYDKEHPAPPRGAAASFDNDEVLSFVDENEAALIRAADLAVRAYRTTGIPAGVHGTVLFVAERGRMDPDRIEAWVAGIASGAGLETGDPRLALRNRLARNPVLRRDQVSLWYLITRAFNAFMHDKRLAKISGDTTTPPPVVKITAFQTKAAGRIAHVARPTIIMPAAAGKAN